MTNRLFYGWLMLGAVLTCAVQADDGRRFGSSRSRDYGYSRDGYSLPRQQPVLPTRPFFVQPYPRNDLARDGRRAYRHGYHEGYEDGYTDRDRSGRHHRGGYDRGRHGGYDDRSGGWNSGYRNHPNAGYGGGYPTPYYAPQPGVSIYYRDR